MEPDDIARLVEEIKISNVDEPSIILEEEDVRSSQTHLANCLAAKVISSKAINKETFRQQIGRILQALQTIKTMPLGDNLFILEFSSIMDRRRALGNGPWNFFRDLVIFKEIYGKETPQTMIFKEISIWVQCHNMPPALMHRNFIEKLGSQNGSIEELDSGKIGNYMGSFTRIRVRIDIKQPVKRFIRVGMGGTKDDLIIILAYERLPDFCYACGCIGHPFRECDRNPVPTGKLEYGPWLRAVQLIGGNRSKSHLSQNTKHSSDIAPHTGKLDGDNRERRVNNNNNEGVESLKMPVDKTLRDCCSYNDLDSSVSRPLALLTTSLEPLYPNTINQQTM
ncbi:uncharacterized protein [Primulina eburnea]|uniref:uncharacterized protein n=1 Tax=Primulina eburnea TaxID=1245227 RepID=UPI003C6C4946